LHFSEMTRLALSMVTLHGMVSYGIRKAEMLTEHIAILLSVKMDQSNSVQREKLFKACECLNFKLLYAIDQI
jgi:hypothetical protein